MDESALARPDITLTLDGEGVIRSAVSSPALEDERLEEWRGRRFEDTVDLEITKLLASIRSTGRSGCFVVRQTFPSGRELPIEYTAVDMGRGGILAIGKNLQVIADLQARLLAAQKERELDYWKLREIETRYRLVFDASSEAAALVRTTNLRVVEANLAASRAFGLVPGGEFLPELAPRERRAFDSMLERVREQGRAPGIAVHVAGDPAPWSLRASMATTQADSFYLFQIARIGADAPAPERVAAPNIEELVQRMPDGFLVVDREGAVRRANNTFLDLAQVGAESAILGQKAKRWLNRPGCDIGFILGMVQRHGSVRMLATQLEGELGSTTEVEVSAVGDTQGSPEFVGLLVRDIGMRDRGDAVPRPGLAGGTSEPMSLEARVRSSVEAIERSTIVAALEKHNGHRTAAAKYLGLSRQSLHAKLKKYGFEEK